MTYLNFFPCYNLQKLLPNRLAVLLDCPFYLLTSFLISSPGSSLLAEGYCLQTTVLKIEKMKITFFSFFPALVSIPKCGPFISMMWTPVIPIFQVFLSLALNYRIWQFQREVVSVIKLGRLWIPGRLSLGSFDEINCSGEEAYTSGTGVASGQQSVRNWRRPSVLQRLFLQQPCK